MDNEVVHLLKHKEWRKNAKKERRRRIRQKFAKQRDAENSRLREQEEKDPEYLKRNQELEKQKQIELINQEKERIEREKQWLEEEERAQNEWQCIQKSKEKDRQLQEEEREIELKEYNYKQEILQKKQLEEKHRFEEELRKQKEFQQEVDDYIDKGAKTPENMRMFRETNPGKEICPFFDKTNACRYGDNCSRNHRKIGLSKVILIPHFYSHFSLEKNAAEYDTDIGLEYDFNETRRHFREFYKDIVPELENFGRIKTLRVCCNSQFHLRGNVYVEYYSERYAAHAVRNLKGRWYGGRQLHCEFANIQSWRYAICGLKKNCPKGKRACNFLHTFRNPDDEYAVKSPPKYVRSFYGYTAKTENCVRSERRTQSKWGDIERLSADEDKHDDNKNWRWSESPDREHDNYQRSDNRNYNPNRNHRNYYRRNNRGTNDNDGSRSPSSVSSKDSITPERRRHSSSRRSKHLYKRSRNHDHYSDEEEDHKKKRKRRNSSDRHRRHRSSHRRYKRRSGRDHKSRRKESPYSNRSDSEVEKRSRDSKENVEKEYRNKISNEIISKNVSCESVKKKPTNELTSKDQKKLVNRITEPAKKNSSESESDSSSESSSEESSDESASSKSSLVKKALIKKALVQKLINYQKQQEHVPVRKSVVDREYEWDTTESEGENKK